MRAPLPAYSYRADPSVPAFDDRFPIAVMDAHCALCSAGARWIDRLDRSGTVRICPLPSPLGSALMRHYGMRVDDPQSWLLIENGCGVSELDAVVQLARRCGWLGQLLRPLMLLPRRWRSALYRWVARNRIRWFGRADLCAAPTPSLRQRLIGVPERVSE
jgi:predicted DCC family thiol-disulfide oxidoreductase YuxK